jgi:hypothetical protein
MKPEAKARFLLARQRQRQRNRQESQVILLTQPRGLSSNAIESIAAPNSVM